jgi:CheY-like chemotaxis protein
MLEYDRSLPEQSRDALVVIRRSGEHMVSLIDGLLDIARIESGKLTLDNEEVRLPEFIDQIAGMFRVQARNKGIDFEYQMQGKVPGVVRVDKKRLGQILINVLGNAVKFTERGKVQFWLRCRSNMASFEVRDSGIGIAPEDLQRVFLPFERGAVAGGEGGTGLGLTIARMLTGLMGGELTAHSTPGQGSVFEVRLFLPEVREPRAVPAVPAPDLVGYAGPRRRVLVVDNEAVDRRFLLKVLQPLGFEVSEAASGIEALQQVPHVQPDLILLDIGMPGIDGWETARLLRAGAARHVPILVISADASEAERDDGSGIGRRDFLVKPVSVTLLLQRIREKLGLVWIARGESAGPTPAAGTDTAAPQATPPLPPGQLDCLRELGALGHVRGILDKLDEIERLDPRLAGFTARLRSDIKAFQLSDFMRRLEAVREEQLP